MVGHGHGHDKGRDMDMETEWEWGCSRALLAWQEDKHRTGRKGEAGRQGRVRVG